MSPFSKAASLTVGLLLAIGSTVAAADGPDLAELRSSLANPSIPAEERARRALEGATAIDQAAQEAASPSGRRKLWGDAIGLLDEFLSKNPSVASAPLIRFQAGVYRWAEGRSFVQQWDLAPGDAQAKAGAVRALDDAIRRLRGVGLKPSDAADPFGQNVRFRLAQSISDRARLEPENDQARLSAEREALAMLDGSMITPGLRGYTRLLRADLSNRLRLFGQAQMEIEEAEKLSSPPSLPDLLEAKVGAMIGRDLFDDARSAVESSKASDDLKRLLTLRIVLGRRRGLTPNRERREIDAEAFRVARPMAGSSRPEARRGLMELARIVDEPPGDAPPEWWDLLAEGRLRLGEPARAGRLEEKGADRAEALGLIDQAASLRFKAGGCLFEAEKFAEADRSLSKVVESTKAPRDLRGRSGMLRALARGRAVAARQPGSSRASYQEALEGQIRDFPDEPSSGEARWLLGQIRLASDRRDDAINLFSGIRHGHPRWLDARMIMADLLREAVEVQRINRDEAASRARIESARKALRLDSDLASPGDESVGLLLKLARLELTPGLGDPSGAIEVCDRLLRAAAGPEQHRLARVYRLVGLAEAGRSVEAEQAARSESRAGTPSGLFPAIGPLGRSAAEADSEAARRRLGIILRIITTRMVERIEEIPPADRDEVRLQHARALLFAGDLAGSRREVMAWGGPKEADDPELLRELADLYQRLEAFELAIDVERLRAGRLPTGSLPWFEAKYGLALAYYRSDRVAEARRLIDATIILHPDLGGGELRGRFERLRQKLGNDTRKE